MKRYLKRIPVRSARGRNPADRLAADPARHHPARPGRRNPPTPITRSGREEGSPLAALTRAPDARRCRGRSAPEVIVDHAMRYGQPGHRRAARRAEGAGLRAHPDRAALSAILRGDDGDRGGRVPSRHLGGQRWLPAVRTLPPYHDDPAYIDALASVGRGRRRRAGFRAAGARSPASMACRSGRWSLAIPIIAIAARPRGCCPTRWAASLGRLPVPLRPRQMAGARDRHGAEGAARPWRDASSPSSPRASRPTAWRHWRSWRSAGKETFLAARRDPFRLSALPQRFRWRASKMLRVLLARELEGWRPAQ